MLKNLPSLFRAAALPAFLLAASLPALGADDCKFSFTLKYIANTKSTGRGGLTVNTIRFKYLRELGKSYLASFKEKCGRPYDPLIDDPDAIRKIKISYLSRKIEEISPGHKLGPKTDSFIVKALNDSAEGKFHPDHIEFLNPGEKEPQGCLILTPEPDLPHGELNTLLYETIMEGGTAPNIIDFPGAGEDIARYIQYYMMHLCHDDPHLASMAAAREMMLYNKWSIVWSNANPEPLNLDRRKTVSLISNLYLLKAFMEAPAKAATKSTQRADDPALIKSSADLAHAHNLDLYSTGKKSAELPDTGDLLQKIPGSPATRTLKDLNAALPGLLKGTKGNARRLVEQLSAFLKKTFPELQLAPADLSASGRLSLDPP